MPDLLSELHEQPQALRELARYYTTHSGEIPRPSSSRSRLLIFTGMGASYHTAMIAAAQAGTLGLPSLAIEATDIIHYHSTALLQRANTVVYISQSGKSVEVGPLLDLNHDRADIIAVTNNPESPLGKRAHAVIPIFAKQIFRLASKNYVNTLAALWLLVRRWAGIDTLVDLDYINGVAARMERVVNNAAATTRVLMENFEPCEQMVFIGHGPHLGTARQAALMLSEWARTPCQYTSVGTYRHGFVETVTPKTGALFFAPPGRSCQSALTLARALPEFGVTTRRISYGELCELEDETASAAKSQLDEFLSPMLDVVPLQYFAEELSKKKGVVPDFQYIDKTRVL